MIPFLDPLRQSIWLKITSLAFGCGFLSVLLWVIVTKLMTQGEAYAALLAGGLTLAVAVLVGKVITAQAIESTDFLARAILLVTREESDIQPPDPAALSVNREFLIKLAKGVYDLASGLKIKSEEIDPEKVLYQSMINSMPIPVIVLNKDQVVTYLNESAVKYIETDLNEALNQPIYDIMNLSFSSMTLEDWIDECTKSCVTDEEVWERVRLNLSDEKRKQFDLSAHYSKDDSNGLEIILTIFDRTQVYERDDHDLTFVSLAVHELRTPLTIMRGYIEVFQDELTNSLNGEQTTFMHNMAASADQLSAFVSNILNVARIEENALYLRLKEDDWKSVLTQACQDMELRAKVHNQELVYDIADNLPTVAVDKVSIYEVIANIIDNAIKYTHTAEKIEIKSYEKDGMIETTITDKGVGIAGNIINHIFDKFYRAHQSKNSVGGTGLGLYLCRAIVNAHGGQIWVNSKEGEGATFGFSLPIYATVADQIKNPDNKGIIRGAHGWIKNHSFYRE